MADGSMILQAAERSHLLVRPPRDMRLDLIRGWMQVSIFVSHVAGNVFAWGIHAAWGLSDSAEQFIFLSGLALGSVFTLKSTRAGYWVAQQDLLWRAARLYRTQLLLFLGFAAMVVVAALLLRQPQLLGWGGWCLLVQAPWLALPGAALLVYQPQYMDVLPGFVFGMLALGPFLWLEARIGAWALLPSALIYGAVQFGWLSMPSVGEHGIGFDPLAWHFLYLLGGFFGRRALLGKPLPRHPLLLWGSVLILAFGLLVRLTEHGFIDGPKFAIETLHHKQILAPLRLFHALSVAYVVALWVPREAARMRGRLGQWLAMLGRHSLPVFCLGLYLAWMLNTAAQLMPGEVWWLHTTMVPAGVVLLGVWARRVDVRLTGRARAVQAA